MSRFPLHGLTSTFRKFQTRESLLPHEEKAIINFVNRFTTCTLNPASIAGMTRDKTLKEQSLKVVNIVKCANIHHHTKTCRKYDITCRFKFGKFPIWKTLISKPSQLLDSKQQENMPDYKALLKKVRSILDNDEIIQSVLSQYPDKELECRKDFEKNREIRIKKVLNFAGLNTEEDFDMYLEALEFSQGGYSVLLERDIDEMFVNSYNPEWQHRSSNLPGLFFCNNLHNGILHKR